MQFNHERSFFENHRNCSPSELWASFTEAAYSDHSIAIHSISMAGCINAVRAIVCFELPARKASNFCDFWKLTSWNFIAFISSLIEVHFCFFYMCLLRIHLPNLCPNMNHFDAVDFSECQAEEVISFFWRSVYKLLYCHGTFQCHVVTPHVNKFLKYTFFQCFLWFVTAILTHIMINVGMY